ncbi:MAG TPA: hypothetical protein VF796_27225 [Humisphaera sp.]
MDVYDGAGEKVEHIDVSGPWVGNVCFGGGDRRPLVVTASNGRHAVLRRTVGDFSQ